MRPVVSNQFTVHVEATFVDKNSTIEFVEYFDYDNNRGKLRQTKHGFVTEYYYDYNTNELLVVSPDTCTSFTRSPNVHLPFTVFPPAFLASYCLTRDLSLIHI